jgi:DNA invertase Pin-like site-specific DNA recombinase
MLGQLRSGETVVVWKLDRLGRSLRDLIDQVAAFKSRGVEFISLQDAINTVTPTGRFTFNIFASLAEFAREIIRERTKAGLAAAKARGRSGGRPAGISSATLEKAKSAKLLYDSGTKARKIAKILGISRATCYRYIEYAANF